MDELIRSMYQPSIDALKSYDIKDEELKAQIDEWIRKVEDLANSSRDASVFMSRFMESGLQGECTAMISKAYMQSVQASSTQNNTSSKPLSVKQFVEQYRTAYDEVAAAGYRKRGEKAYCDLFAVADRTDDMIEAQIIIEKERLLWKIVSEDSLDIFESVLEAMDPLSFTSKPLALHVEAYKQSSSDEELSYRIELLETQKQRAVQEGTIKMSFAAQLAFLLLSYQKARMELWRWASDNMAKNALLAMIKIRKAARDTLQTLQETLGMSFDDVLADEGMKIWMLSPQNCDALGRIKASMLPQNYEAYRDMIRNEILSDSSIEETVMRRPPVLISFALTKTHDRFIADAMKTAETLNSELTYFRYMNRLEDTAKQFLPKGAVQTAKPSKLQEGIDKLTGGSISTASSLKGLFGKLLKH